MTLPMQAFGYCWGVQRAVEMAYEARKQYPGQKLHITNGEMLVLQLGQQGRIKYILHEGS